MSPFYGESDICPKVKSTFFLNEGFTKLNMQFCTENLYLMFQSLFPPDVKVRGASEFWGWVLFSPLHPSLPGDPAAIQASRMAHWVKNLPEMQETQEMWVRSLSWGKEMGSHSIILA